MLLCQDDVLESGRSVLRSGGAFLLSLLMAGAFLLAKILLLFSLQYFLVESLLLFPLLLLLYDIMLLLWLRPSLSLSLLEDRKLQPLHRVDR